MVLSVFVSNYGDLLPSLLPFKNDSQPKHLCRWLQYAKRAAEALQIHIRSAPSLNELNFPIQAESGINFSQGVEIRTHPKAKNNANSTENNDFCIAAIFWPLEAFLKLFTYRANHLREALLLISGPPNLPPGSTTRLGGVATPGVQGM